MTPAEAQAEFLALLGTRPLTRTGGVALHWQCGEVLKRTIDGMRYPPGVPLPPENDMARALGISRPTLRQAMMRLASDGVVHSQRGVGTFVLRSSLVRPVGLSSLYRDLQAVGRTPTTKVLVVEPAIADEQVAAALRIAPGRPLLHLERVRYADGVPVVFTHSLLHLPDGVTLTKEQLQADGLYSLLHRIAGIELVGGTQTVSARRATPEEAEELEIEPDAPVMVAQRVAFDTAGRGVEYVYIVYPEGIELSTDLRGTSMLAATAPTASPAEGRR